MKFDENSAGKWQNSSEKAEWKKLKFVHFTKNLDDFSLNFLDLSGAKDCKSCRSRKMLKNKPTLASGAVDTAENEPLKISLVHFISSILSLFVPPRQAARFSTVSVIRTFSSEKPVLRWEVTRHDKI